MPNFIKPLPLPAKTFVNASSRYIGSKVIQYTENKHTTFEIYKRNKLTKNASDQWLEITKAVEYRPDLVSTEIFGTPDFWWRLLEYNGMKDILEFKAGVNIRISGDIWR